MAFMAEARLRGVQMHGAVRELEANMDQLSVSQQYANHGIYVLCKVHLELITSHRAAQRFGRTSCSAAASQLFCAITAIVTFHVVCHGAYLPL